MKKILIVDDLTENRCLMEGLLEGAGYSTVSAPNGKEALDRLREASFDLIISDILMPVMDGFQLCRECKTKAQWRDIPFIFYTATYAEKKDEAFALALGADRFIIKPQEPERLLEILKESLAGASDTAAKGPVPEVTAYLAMHNERLMEKLEKKVADLDRVNRELRESEKKYRLLADNVEDVIFLLDMDLNYAYVSPSVKSLRGYEPAEVMSQPAFATITPASWELAMKTLAEAKQLEESGQGGLHRSWMLELEVRRRDGSTVWTEMRISFVRDENNQLTGILGVTRDITARKKSEEAMAASFQNLRKALGGTVQAIAMLVEARDPYTAGHQRRVADLSRAIAEEMGLDYDRKEGLRMAAMIHDIGKISIPAEILSKPTKLTATEFELIKTQPQTGYDILKEIEFPWPIDRIVFQHHERMDGSGYPLGVKGEEILREARILAIADIVEAIASHRPYRPALGAEAAMDEIARGRGVAYDPEAVDACLKLFREKGYQLEKS